MRLVVRRQDILLFLLYCLGFSKIRNYVLRKGGKPVTRFVLFHDIPEYASGSFLANLSFLKRSTNVISLDDHVTGKLSLHRINVVITFDDGYQSWVTRALPALKKLDLPATFFVSSGFVGLSPKEQAKFVRSNLRLSTRKSQGVAGLSEDDLRQLADAGFTIGGHTLTHADLARINDMDTLIHEVAEDKRRLERISGQPVHYFAYPYGSFRNPNHLLPRILAAVGYRAATTTLPGFNTPESDRYLLKRELTNAEMSSCVFRARVLGNTDGAQFLRHWVWQRLPGRFDAEK